MSYDIKQVIVVRKDLNMRKGKMCAQVAHASMKFLFDQNTAVKEEMRIISLLNGPQVEWCYSNFPKIVLSVDSEEELKNLIKLGRENEMVVSEIIDLGYTEFHKIPTLTCAAFGPDLCSEIDKITGHLKLL
jgi:PTH2 family peptidyl-tRNA hydrolase